MALSFLVALLFGWGLNEANLRFVTTEYGPYRPDLHTENARQNARSTVAGVMIYSIETNWYLPQVEHLLGGRGYTLDPSDPAMSVRRAPGYSLFLFVHRVLTGEAGFYRAVRTTQLVLFALCAPLLALAVFALSGSSRFARAAALVQALSPHTAAYAYYAMTEAVQPVLVALALVVYAFAVTRPTPARVFAAGLSTAIAALTRPVLGLLLPVFMLGLLLRLRELRCSVARVGMLLGVMSLGLIAGLLPWTVRNYVVTGGRVVPLETVTDPMGRGPALGGLQRWWAAWGHPYGGVFAYQDRLLAALRRGDEATAEAEEQKLLATLPSIAFSGASRESVALVLHDLRECLAERLGNPGTRALPACESDVEARFDALTARFRLSAPVRYFLITPLTSVRTLVLQSYSSALTLLNPRDGHLSPAQVVAKSTLYGLVVMLYMSTLLLAFSSHPSALRAVVAGFPAALLFFLCFVFRVAIESRYMVAAYPLLSVGFAHLLVTLPDRLPTRLPRRGEADK